MYGDENERRKRGIIVPVVTLAVCAIAMVGLGFAITSSVVSDSNAVEELMIDMSADKAYFDTAEIGGTPGGKDKPGSGNVNGILGLKVYNDKTGTNPGFKATGGFAYMKIYGNVTNFTLNAEAQPIGSPASVSATLALYDASGKTLQKVATATITAGDATFVVDSGKKIECGKIFAVTITGLNGSTFTYGDDGKITSTTVSGTTNITNVKYTFTATTDTA